MNLAASFFPYGILTRRKGCRLRERLNLGTPLGYGFFDIFKGHGLDMAPNFCSTIQLAHSGAFSSLHIFFSSCVKSPSSLSILESGE